MLLPVCNLDGERYWLTTHRHFRNADHYWRCGLADGRIAQANQARRLGP
jgi:hypothetical protein